MPVRFDLTILDNDGIEVAIFDRLPELAWSYKLGNVDMGDIRFSVALSDPLLTQDLFVPYGNDFQLNMRVGDAGLDPDLWDSFPVHAGIITSVNVRSDEGVLRVTGKDWLHWMEQPYGSFDWSLTLAGILAGTVPVQNWLNAQTRTVLDGLLDSITTGTYDLPLTHNGLADPAFSETISHTVTWDDATSVLEQWRAISSSFDPRGFDFWSTWDKTIEAYGPRLRDPATASPLYTLTGADKIVSLDWTNNGPYATDTLVFGSGTGNLRMLARDTPYTPSMDQFRRWRRIRSYSQPFQMTDQNALTNYAAGLVDKQPQKELRMTVKPDALDPADETAGFQPFLAETVDVDYTFAGADGQPGYHRIDAMFYVTGQEYRADDAGNWLLDLTLDQLYTPV